MRSVPRVLGRNPGKAHADGQLVADTVADLHDHHLRADLTVVGPGRAEVMVFDEHVLVEERHRAFAFRRKERLRPHERSTGQDDERRCDDRTQHQMSPQTRHTASYETFLLCATRTFIASSIELRYRSTRSVLLSWQW